MSEYWKSNPRKFCDYCKCWFADNKSSIEFHERGKRHQEAVQLKISELQKKGVKDAKAKEQFTSDMQKMEEAAMNALKEDLRRDPSLATAYGLELKESGCELPPVDYKPPPAAEEKKEPIPSIPASISKKKPLKRRDKGAWKLLKSPEGFPYYWNTKTNAVQWTAPDGYVDETKTVRDEASDDDTNGKHKEEEIMTESTKTDTASCTPELIISRIPLPSEATPKPRPDARKKRPAGAYGSWTEVETEEEVPPDLELPPPATPRITLQTAALAYSEAPKITFKQKIVTSLAPATSKSTGIVFKKRKINAGNMRSRDDDL